MFKRIAKLFTQTKQADKPNDYKKMEIDVVIKYVVSAKEKPFRVIFQVIQQGSFFSRDIFVKQVDDRTQYELFYNFSTLGMSFEELSKYGGTDYAEYRFNTLEEAKKVKETTVQYIRFLINEHQQQSIEKIS